MSIPAQLALFDDRAAHFINTLVEIECLGSSFRFTEGPVWNAGGFYLFSDIPENCIYKIDNAGNCSVYLQPSGCLPGNTRNLAEQVGSNALAHYTDGSLLVCQHGEGAVAHFDGKVLKPFIATYNGRPFNSPNDIVVHPDGTVYLSDPPYGLKDKKLDPLLYQPVAGLYCYRDGEVRLITDEYQFPNGVCLSPDSKKLYSVSSKPYEARVLEWDAASLRLNREVAAETGDGIKCDRAGNLFLCTKEGILMIDEAGKRLARIGLESIPSNCCWGGADGNDLFITAVQNIFRIRNLLKG